MPFLKYTVNDLNASPGRLFPIMIVGSIDKEWLQVIDMRRLLERGVYFKVCGKRKREVGLVVPGC